MLELNPSKRETPESALKSLLLCPTLPIPIENISSQSTIDNINSPSNTKGFSPMSTKHYNDKEIGSPPRNILLSGSSVTFSPMHKLQECPVLILPTMIKVNPIQSISTNEGVHHKKKRQATFSDRNSNPDENSAESNNPNIKYVNMTEFDFVDEDRNLNEKPASNIPRVTRVNHFLHSSFSQPIDPHSKLIMFKISPL